MITREQIAEIRMRVFLGEPLPTADAQALFMDWERVREELEEARRLLRENDERVR